MEISRRVFIGGGGGGGRCRRRCGTIVSALRPLTTSFFRDYSSSSVAYAMNVNSTNDRNGVPSHIDTLIIGAGPVGASTAYHLARRRQGNTDNDNNDKSQQQQQPSTEFDPSILVVERDRTCNSGSAVYSAGGIRLQFSLRQNVEMSLYGIDFLRRASSNLALRSTSKSIRQSTVQNGDAGSPSSVADEVDLQYIENGYLFLASNEDGAKQLYDNYELLTDLRCNNMVELLQPDDIRARFPWMNVDDVVLGSHGVSGEGWFDPWTFIHSLNEKNKEMGVQYVDGTVVGSTRDPDTGKIVSIQVQDGSSTEIHVIHVSTVVNAAGAAASGVLDTLAGPDNPLIDELPVRPRKRSMYYFNCDKKQVPDGDIVPDMAPLTIDHSGAYFRSEGVVGGTGNFICGMSPPKDQDYDCYDRDELANADPNLFEENIWPALYNRVNAFGCIKVKSSWAGLYEYNTIDQNCILDFHPELPNVLLVNGFSGHGLQHSPAAGLAAAELIDEENKFVSIDLDVFRFDRIINNKPVFERGIY